MFVLFLIIFFAYRLLTMDYEVRILQVNHYQLDRTWMYLKENSYLSTRRFRILLIHLPFFFLFFVEERQLQIRLYTLLLIVYFYFIYRFHMLTKRKVALRYTKRVLRLYFCFALLYGISLVLIYSSRYFLLFSLLIMMSNPIYCALGALCMHPIEKLINDCYVEKAKHILKQQKHLIKIGIVGSYGKTSTKNILYHLLSEKYYCLKSEKSYNNRMGNTLMITRYLKRVHEVMIAEMGSDHLGELKKLMDFIEPNYVIITAIGNQHLKTFKSQERIIKEKLTPLRMLSEQDYAFLNLDNPYLYANRNLGKAHKIYFGEHRDADYRLCDIVMNEKGSHFNIAFQNQLYGFETTLLGYYNLMNLCGAIACAHTLGVRFEGMQKIVPQIKAIEHRLESRNYGKYTLIDNAYNSNVNSFQNTLEVLGRIKKYKILITPGIIEVGEEARVNHRLIQKVKGKVDEVVIVGYHNRSPLCEGLHEVGFENFHLADTMEEALSYVDQLNLNDYVVCIENDIDKVIMNQHEKK